MDRKLAEQIGKAARKARTARGLSQAEVAERLEKSTEFYGRLERGATLPSVETLVQVARVLDASADALLGLTDAPRVAPRDDSRSGSTSRERLLLLRLRRATPRAARIVGLLLGELERAAGTSRRKRKPGTRSK